MELFFLFHPQEGNQYHHQTVRLAGIRSHGGIPVKDCYIPFPVPQQENNLVLPLVVLEELDGLKKAEGEKGANARAAVRKLESYRQKGDLLQGVKLPGGGILRIEHNLRLVAHVVKKYQGTGEDTDDLISIGTIGLIKAVTTFNPQKASRLSTYAARCIENELLMYFRAKKKHSKEVSLYEPIGTDKEGNEINLLDVIESAPVDIVEDCYIRENTDYLLRSLKKVLSDKEYQVICCRYGLFGMEEETQREIARKLCISRSYVSRIEKTALQKLRGLFPQMQ